MVNFIFVFGITAGILLALSPLIKLWLSKAILAQARKLDEGWFTQLPQPGRFSFVFTGGNLRMTLENVNGWKLTEYKTAEKEVFERSNDKKEEHEGLAKELGVVWIGPYSTLRKFEKWKWTEFRQKKDAQGKLLTEYESVPREEDVYDFLHQFIYSVDVKDMELLGNIQVKATALITVWILYPKRAFLDNKNWVDTFNGIAQSAIRGWATTKNFPSFKKETSKATHDSEFCKMLMQLNGITLAKDGNPDYDSVKEGGLFDVLGVVIWNAVLQDLEANDREGEILREQEENRLKAAANLEAAEGAQLVALKNAETEVKVTNQRRKARQKWIQETIVEPIINAGPGVAEVLAAELVTSKESKLTTWVRGNAGVVVPADNKNS